MDTYSDWEESSEASLDTCRRQSLKPLNSKGLTKSKNVQSVNQIL